MQKLIIANGKIVKDYSELPADLRRLEFRIFQAHAQPRQNYEFDLPRGRGMFYSMDTFGNQSSLAGGSQAIFTTSIDGRVIQQDNTLIQYMTEYQKKECNSCVDIVGWGGSTFKITLTTEFVPADTTALIFVFSYTQENGLKPPNNIG